MKINDVPSANHAARLMDFVSMLQSAAMPPMPPLAFDNARRCLLDAIGCGLFGASQPWSHIMSAQLFAEKSQGASTVFGHAATLAAPAAALCNGTAIHGFELDDLLPAAIIHPGTVIVPAVLAVAESAREKNAVSGEQLLRAIIIGYEVTARISLAMGTDASHHGFHKTSVVGPVAAAIAASCVLNLNAAQISCAAGIAASMASGIKSYVASGGGGMVKRMHAGWAASSGVRAALLARDGFTGPSGAVDGRYGLLEVFGGASANAEPLTQGLGESWAINAVWFKVYPLCGWIQGVVQLLGAMRGEITQSNPLTPDQIKKVVVGTSAFAVNGNSNATPADTMDAQYSIPYCAALALMRDPGDPRAFEPAAFNDPALRALAARVETRVDDECEAVYPRRFGSRVALHLANGEVKEALTLDPHGTPSDPCSDVELAAKFTRLAALSPLGVDSAAIARTVAQLRAAASLREFSHLLRAA
jgi:2-methylcitrate dehydratase PrpD